MIKRLIPVILAGALLYALGACAPAGTSTPTPVPQATAKPEAAAPTPAAKPTPRPLEKVKIQIPAPAPLYFYLDMGRDKGIFQAEGLDVETIILRSDLAVPALLKGEVDYVAMFSGPMKATLKGEAIKVFMVTTSKADWRLFLGQGLTSIEQVKGKAVAAATVAGIDRVATERGLKQLGLNTEKDVTFVTLPTYADMLVALKSGALGAAALQSPEIQLARAAGLKEMLDLGDVLPSPIAGVSTTTKRIQENPDQVKRLIKAILKSMTYVRDHKEEAAAVAGKVFSQDSEAAKNLLEGSVGGWAYDGAVTDRSLAAYVDVLKSDQQAGLQNATVEQMKKGVDYELLAAALKELGLSR
ncbi:MAG: ABC transporter substrate-binding protein [Dehalococcoidia bacterium]|nr:ABC transporter substrate-binding protein [Dehalococcoidia bacterium]